MKKILFSTMLIVGLSGCVDNSTYEQCKSQVVFHRMDASTKGQALAILGSKYRKLKAGVGDVITQELVVVQEVCNLRLC